MPKRPRPPKRPSRPRPRQAERRPPKPAPAPTRRIGLYALTPPGLQGVLADEAKAALSASDVLEEKGLIRLSVPSPPAAPLRLLSCDRAALQVREAGGNFLGARGFAEVRSKLARTDFDRALGVLSECGLAQPATFSVVADIAPACEFAFFDVKREVPGIVARRLGLEPSEDGPDLLVHLACSAETLLIGLCLPLLPLSRQGSYSRDLPRALVGALTYLAGPAPRVAVADPDCGGSELLHAWQAASGPGRLVGMTFGAAPPEAVPWLARASHRAWPVADHRLSRVVSALPRLRSPAEVAHLLDETARCLAPGGRATYLLPGGVDVRAAIDAHPRLVLERAVPVELPSGSRTIAVLAATRAAPSHRTPTTAGDRARAARGLGGVQASRKAKKPRKRSVGPAKRRPRKP